MAHGHDVVKDSGGFAQAERYTCNSPGCGQNGITRQPHMSNAFWEKIKKTFFNRHPPADPNIK